MRKWKCFVEEITSTTSHGTPIPTCNDDVRLPILPFGTNTIQDGVRLREKGKQIYAGNSIILIKIKLRMIKTDYKAVIYLQRNSFIVAGCGYEKPRVQKRDVSLLI